MTKRLVLGAAPCLASIFFFSACGSHEMVSESIESTSSIDSASNAITQANVVVKGTGHIGGSVNIDGYMSLAAAGTGCNNRGGPDIKVYGDIVLGKVGSKLTAANNMRRTHERTIETSALVELYNDNQVIKVAKGGKYGVSGNPDMYLEVFDHADKSVAKVYLGRCNSPKAAQRIDFSFLSDIDLYADGGNCSGVGGPTINISGSLVLKSFKANLILQKRNGRNQVETPVTFAISLVPPGQTIVFNKQPPLGGVGGNPWLWATLTDHRNNSISPELLLGRCNDF